MSFIIKEHFGTTVFLSHYNTLVSSDKPVTRIPYYIDIIPLFTILMAVINPLLKANIRTLVIQSTALVVDYYFRYS